MRATEPLPLHHSWMLLDRNEQFNLGHVMDSISGSDILGHPGHWSCELASQTLTWSPAVYDIFGLPRGARLSRPETLALYSDTSRAAMERLRNYAIRHRRGFTLDAEIAPASGPARWMRLIVAPVCREREVIRIEGYKRDVSHLYR